MTTQAYESCHLCPRNCGVDRTAGQTGFCGETDQIRAARAALHFWEEPCISGTAGSGAVFFTGCTLRCVFCQNRPIARSERGKVISEEWLAEIFLDLQEQGANNINLVTAGHFLPQVIGALESAKEQGLVIPVVYNTSGYEKAETIRALDGLVDIYLPDLKYVDAGLSKKYSQAPDYFAVASAAIREMVRQTGEPVFLLKPEAVMQESYALWGEDSSQRMDAEEYNECCDQYQNREILMRQGTIVRHLILPGSTEDSKAVIRWLFETFGDDIYISIMNQYTPMESVSALKPLNRKVTDREYNEVVDYAIDLGVTNAFIQEGGVAEESFIPDFGFEGL